MPHPHRTPPKQMAEWLAEILQEEELDYQYVKEVFRHTRTLLDIGPKPPVARPRELLDPEEAYRVFQAASDAGQPRHRTMLRLQMLTGLKTGELIALQVDQVDLEQMQIRLPARGRRSERVVVLPERLREELTYQVQRARAAGDGHLFLSHHRTPYKARYVRRLFRQCGERAGLDKRVTADAMRLQLLVYLTDEGIVGDDLLEAARTARSAAMVETSRLTTEEKRAAAERAAARYGGRPTLVVAEDEAS